MKKERNRDKPINPILIVVFQVRRNLRIWVTQHINAPVIPFYEEKAKENQGTRNDLNIPPNSGASDIKIRNRDNETERQLAKLANVGNP